MADGDNKRVQEGALSALKTPTNPPVEPKLVPLNPAKATGNGTQK
jgi:hypothetical protein